MYWWKPITPTVPFSAEWYCGLDDYGRETYHRFCADAERAASIKRYERERAASMQRAAAKPELRWTPYRPKWYGPAVTLVMLSLSLLVPLCTGWLRG